MATQHRVFCPRLRDASHLWMGGWALADVRRLPSCCGTHRNDGFRRLAGAGQNRAQSAHFGANFQTTPAPDSGPLPGDPAINIKYRPGEADPWRLPQERGYRWISHRDGPKSAMLVGKPMLKVRMIQTRNRGVYACFGARNASLSQSAEFDIRRTSTPGSGGLTRVENRVLGGTRLRAQKVGAGAYFDP